MLFRSQQSVALSSMEAEYMALCLATQEAVWLIEILNNLKFLQRSPIIIHEDNKSCIDFSNYNVPHFLLLMIFLPFSGDPEIDEVPSISGDS